MKLLTFSLALSFVITAASFGQPLPADQEQLLIPIAPDRIFGAVGTTWDTDLSIANSADAPTTVWGYIPSICMTQCSTVPPPIPPRTTIFTGIISDRCTPAIGRILIADRTTADNLFFTLRSRDTSHDDRAWGSIVPVVRTRDRYSRAFSIVDVPVGTGFRALLRLYAMNPAAAGVRVRFFAEDVNVPYSASHSETLILEATPAFAVPPASTAPYCPAYAEIALSQNQTLVSADRIRIEVVPGDSAQQYWGFVSVTNNNTQEVSVITPH